MGRMEPHTLARAIAALFLSAGTCFALLALHCYRAANPSTAPFIARIAQDKKNEPSTPELSEFPEVDWSYWQEVNPDVIGWITVPGTEINHPVLQGPKDEPDFYLTHDAFKNYNPLGALYLDAECATDGLNSRNAVILGHHWEGIVTGCFTVISSYNNQEYAESHKTILIQTPRLRTVYEVRFVSVIPGWKPLKRTSFTDNNDFAQWYETSLDSAEVVLDSATQPMQTISLVSCSYNYWSANERTVVIASKQISPNATQGSHSLSPNVREET